jgi:hypothetical protein
MYRFSGSLKDLFSLVDECKLLVDFHYGRNEWDEGELPPLSNCDNLETL